jgi:hypothetical protein
MLFKRRVRISGTSLSLCWLLFNPPLFPLLSLLIVLRMITNLSSLDEWLL